MGNNEYYYTNAIVSAIIKYKRKTQTMNSTELITLIEQQDERTLKILNPLKQ